MSSPNVVPVIAAFLEHPKAYSLSLAGSPKTAWFYTECKKVEYRSGDTIAAACAAAMAELEKRMKK